MDLLAPTSWKLIAAVITAIAATVYLLFRLGQFLSLGSTNKETAARSRRESSSFESRLCPDFDEREIKAATRSYVRPDCAQIDPANEVQMHGFASIREQVYAAVDRFVLDDAKRHVIILADSGMGKTTFCLNYYARFKRADFYLALVSLSQPEAEARIVRVPSKRSTVLLLDAFDEDAAAMTQGAQRLYNLLSHCTEFRTVIVTCRSQFFENDAAIPSQTGLARIAPSKTDASAFYELSRLYLLPFNDVQVSAFLRRQFPLFSIRGFLFRSRAKALVARIPELTVRPMLLALVPDLIKENRAPKELYELYDYLVEKWLLREARWVNTEALLRVSTELAILLMVRKLNQETERISTKDLKDQQEFDFSGIAWEHLTTRSLVNRDSEGKLKFAHRSIMEFLVVKAVVNGSRRALTVPWTSFMRDLLISYTRTSTADLKQVRSGLMRLFKDRHASQLRFPMGESPPRPSERSVEEFHSLANRAPRLILNRSELPLELRDSTIELTSEQGYLFLKDFELDLSWRVPNSASNSVIGSTTVHRSSLRDACRSIDETGYDLPSFPEFLTLLRLQETFPKIALIQDFDFYWIADTAPGATHMIASAGKTISGLGITRILSRADIWQSSKKVNLYGIDFNQRPNTLQNLRALELRVRRGALRRPPVTGELFEPLEPH